MSTTFAFLTMSESNLQPHATVVSAWKNWMQFLVWLSSSRAVLLHKPDFTHFTKFDSLAKALRRVGIHYFEHEGYIIWELGRSLKVDKSGVQVHQYLLDWRNPDFPLSAKQLTSDELDQLRAVAAECVLVGKHTFPKGVAPVVSKKTTQPTLNRRRKANLSARAELDILTTPVNTVDAMSTTVVPYDDAHCGAEEVFGCNQLQPLAYFEEVQEMMSSVTSVCLPQSPDAESYGSPLSVFSASESDGLDEYSFPSAFSPFGFCSN